MAPALGRPAQQQGADARLQLREALAGLAVPDLQQQSAFAVEALLRDGGAPLLDFFLREALRLADCRSGSVRRLRYRQVLRWLAYGAPRRAGTGTQGRHWHKGVHHGIRLE